MEVAPDVLAGYVGEYQLAPTFSIVVTLADGGGECVPLAAALSLSTRQEVRIKVGRRVVLTLADGTSIDSVLENLSLGGAALSAAPESWQEGRPVAFYLGPPERPELLHLVGKVAWRKGKRAGIAFDGATTDLKVRVSSALQELLPRRTTPQAAR